MNSVSMGGASIGRVCLCVREWERHNETMKHDSLKKLQNVQYEHYY